MPWIPIEEIVRNKFKIKNKQLEIEAGGTNAQDAATAVQNLGGLSVVVSTEEPENNNCYLWVKTVS